MREHNTLTQVAGQYWRNLRMGGIIMCAKRLNTITVASFWDWQSMEPSKEQRKTEVNGGIWTEMKCINMSYIVDY